MCCRFRHGLAYLRIRVRKHHDAEPVQSQRERRPVLDVDEVIHAEAEKCQQWALLREYGVEWEKQRCVPGSHADEGKRPREHILQKRELSACKSR